MKTKAYNSTDACKDAQYMLCRNVFQYFLFLLRLIFLYQTPVFGKIANKIEV